MTQPARDIPEVEVGSELGPEAAAEIEALRDRIDDLDQEILRLVEERIALARLAAETRLRSGGPRVVHQRELSVLRTYCKLGDGGRDLGLLVLRLGHGPGRGC
jgi:chorismate mutase